MAIRRTCHVCGGTGCPTCLYTGYTQKGNLEDIYGIFLSYEVLDATDATEYNGLSDNNKGAYGLIISCGMVNLREGSPTKTRLWNMFPGGSGTRIALQALIDQMELME